MLSWNIDSHPLHTLPSHSYALHTYNTSLLYCMNNSLDIHINTIVCAWCSSLITLHPLHNPNLYSYALHTYSTPNNYNICISITATRTTITITTTTCCGLPTNVFQTTTNSLSQSSLPFLQLESIFKSTSIVFYSRDGKDVILGLHSSSSSLSSLTASSTDNAEATSSSSSTTTPTVS